VVMQDGSGGAGGPVVMQVPHGSAVSVQCDLQALRRVCFAFLSAVVRLFLNRKLLCGLDI